RLGFDRRWIDIATQRDGCHTVLAIDIDSIAARGYELTSLLQSTKTELDILQSKIDAVAAEIKARNTKPSEPDPKSADQEAQYRDLTPEQKQTMAAKTCRGVEYKIQQHHDHGNSDSRKKFRGPKETRTSRPKGNSNTSKGNKGNGNRKKGNKGNQRQQ